MDALGLLREKFLIQVLSFVAMLTALFSAFFLGGFISVAFSLLAAETIKFLLMLIFIVRKRKLCPRLPVNIVIGFIMLLAAHASSVYFFDGRLPRVAGLCRYCVTADTGCGVTTLPG